MEIFCESNGNAPAEPHDSDCLSVDQVSLQTSSSVIQNGMFSFMTDNVRMFPLS